MSRSAGGGMMAAGMALLLSATPALAQAQQTIGLRPVEAPTNRPDDARARFYIVDHVPPGATIQRRVEVSNDTAEPQEIALYAGAADIGGGEFRLGETGAANELTGWTTVAPPNVRLGAGAKAEAIVTITVPADAIPGERYGVAWAAVAATTSPGGGILTVNRVGVRIYLSVGPGEEPPTDFAITSLAPGRTSDGAPIVTAIVRNTGGRAVDLTGNLDLRRGPAGRAAGPFAVQGTTLGIGEAEPILIPVARALPQGPWDASLVLRSGSTERSATARMTFPPPPPSTTGQLHTSDAPRRHRRLAVVAGALVVLALLLTLVARRRRRQRHRRSGAF